MTPEEVKAYKRKVSRWVKSEKGQKAMKETTERVKQSLLDAEKKRRDDMVWWAENKHKPITI